MQTKKKKMTAMVDKIRMILRSFSVNGLEAKGFSFFMSRANCLIITHIRFIFICNWVTWLHGYMVTSSVFVTRQPD